MRWMTERFLGRPGVRTHWLSLCVVSGCFHSREMQGVGKKTMQGSHFTHGGFLGQIIQGLENSEFNCLKVFHTCHPLKKLNVLRGAQLQAESHGLSCSLRSKSSLPAKVRSPVITVLTSVSLPCDPNHPHPYSFLSSHRIFQNAIVSFVSLWSSQDLRGLSLPEEFRESILVLILQSIQYVIFQIFLSWSQHTSPCQLHLHRQHFRMWLFLQTHGSVCTSV